MKLRWLLIGLCLILFSLLLPNNLIARAEPNTATTYYVTGTSDPTPGACIVRSGGGGYDCASLRSAVIAANANPGWDTILLHHNTTYQLTIPITSSDQPATGDLDITQHLTFDYTNFCLVNCGATIQGGPNFNNRLLEIDNGIRVNMHSITFRNGYQPNYIGGAICNYGILTLTHGLVYSNTAQYGAGIYNGSNATLTLIDTTVSSNTATTDYGGGLHNLGTTYISNTVFEKNASVRGGGGFYNHADGTVIMTGGIITGNLSDTPSTNYGGGVLNAGWLSMTNTSVISNFTRWGAAGYANDYTGVTYLTAVTVALNVSKYGTGGMSDYGQITLDRVAVLSNTSSGTGGIFASGVLTMTNSQVGYNTGEIVGGLIVDNTHSATIRDSWIFSNTATTSGTGGGIRNRGTLMLTGSTLSGNQAADGGGLYNEAAANLLNSTISGNQADHDGGGIFNNGPTYNLILNNVTLANNQSDADANAVGEGGGLRAVAGNVFVFNTLIAQNSDWGNLNRPDCSGALTTVTYSLIQNTTGCTLPVSATGVITGKAAQIGPLMDHGGATWTHALLPNSPALNTGRPFASGIVLNNCLSTDQRGAARPMGPRCDIGAFELAQVFAPLVVK